MVVWARLRLAELGEDRAVGVARRPGFDDDGGGPRAVQDGKGGQQPAQRRSAVGVGGTGGHRLSLSPLVRVVPVHGRPLISLLRTLGPTAGDGKYCTRVPMGGAKV